MVSTKQDQCDETGSRKTHLNLTISNESDPESPQFKRQADKSPEGKTRVRLSEGWGTQKKSCSRILPRIAGRAWLIVCFPSWPARRVQTL